MVIEGRSQSVSLVNRYSTPGGRSDRARPRRLGESRGPTSSTSPATSCRRHQRHPTTSPVARFHRQRPHHRSAGDALVVSVGRPAPRLRAGSATGSQSSATGAPLGRIPCGSSAASVAERSDARCGHGRRVTLAAGLGDRLAREGRRCVPSLAAPRVIAACSYRRLAPRRPRPVLARGPGVAADSTTPAERGRSILGGR